MTTQSTQADRRPVPARRILDTIATVLLCCGQLIGSLLALPLSLFYSVSAPLPMMLFWVAVAGGATVTMRGVRRAGQHGRATSGWALAGAVIILLGAVLGLTLAQIVWSS